MTVIFSILNDNTVYNKPISVQVGSERAVSVAVNGLFYYQPSNGDVECTASVSGDIFVQVYGTRVTSGSGGTSIPIYVPPGGSKNAEEDTGSNHILAVRCGDGTDDLVDDQKRFKDEASR